MSKRRLVLTSYSFVTGHQDSEVDRELLGLPETAVSSAHLQAVGLLFIYLFFPLSLEKMKRSLSSCWCGGFFGEVRIECAKCFSLEHL